MRPLFCLLFLVVGCDTSEPAPDAAFTVQAVTDGRASEAVGVDPSGAFEAVPTVEVRLAPLRDEPTDPALADRYRDIEFFADLTSLVTGEPHGVGYYLLRRDEPSEPAGAAPVPCFEDELCVTIGDVHLEDDPGAVFFVVPEDSTVSPVFRVRPFGFGRRGHLIVEGEVGSRPVAIPGLEAEPVVLGAASVATVRVERGSSASRVLVAVQRGGGVRTRVFEAESTSLRVSAPEGAGPVRVYVFEVE